MLFTKYSPKQSLNKAYLKEKISRSTMDQFKQNFAVFLNHTNANRNDEEHLKSQVAYFLRDTWFKESHHINPIGKNDLVIHTGKSTADPVGVIIEVKSLTNKAEMLTLEKPNTKALHELVLYYLRQRIEENNNEIKYLIATNIDDWFIFDANEFDKKIYRNSAIKKLYELKKTDNKDNPWFYDELKKLLDHNTDSKLEVAHFSIREFEEVLLNSSLKDDNKLIAIYKLLSPVHLLKLPFANDSNSLQPKFYAELLHLIGLAEIKEGSKKLIQRKKAGERNSGSLIENTISQLESHDKLSRIDKPSQYGETTEERLFNVALELVITWINRILFLKLLEAQLASYHKGDKTYRFLNKEKIQDFDDLDKLFFSVLAKQPNERREEVQKLFAKVPYLNSSLFEPTELEHQTLFIYGLEDRVPLPALTATVLKDSAGKVFKGSLDTIDYLFAFLDAYDFSSEGAEEIQEDNKTLINASVLGLIFEKINGYKDGSFFTPGFITMYMCRETIRRAVVQKFNEVKGWDCKEYGELYDKIENSKEANSIINSLKICDPAVGSGHFLVSALNEIIAVKSDLRILLDRDGRRLKEYQAEIVNDELVVTDDDGQLFEYSPNSKESQRVQESLFHEKQTIIENCLFGVDINPNSVKICRLRLWIELLKNAYYRMESGVLSESGSPQNATVISNSTAHNPQLETLPNIDINIKTGNSLISRFALDADLKAALKGTKWNITDYKIAVAAYKEVSNKEQKHQIIKLIEAIKSNFSIKFYNNSKENKELNKLRGQQTNLLTTNIDLFGAKKTKKDLEIEARRLEIAIEKKGQEIEEIKNNKIYENAFEWRFEFPEALNDEGDFVGFDVVIGNPPYGVNFNKNSGIVYESQYEAFNWRGESYTLFIEKSVNILNNKGSFSFIIPDTLLNLGFTDAIRSYILKNTLIREVALLPSNVFPDATVDTILLFFQKVQKKVDVHVNDVLVNVFNKRAVLDNLHIPERSFKISTKLWFDQNAFNIQSNQTELSIIQKIDSKFTMLSEYSEIFYGIKAYQVGKGNPPQTPVIRDTKPFTSHVKKNEEWLPFFDGKHIGYYQLNWDKNNWLHYGPWLAEPRVPLKFENEKILIRKITGKTLIAHYIPYTSYCNTLLFVLKLKPEHAKIPYKALLGVINSNFIGWYFRKKFQINNEDTFPQIMIRDILQFAVPNEKNDLTKKIESCADQILILKQGNPTMNTREFEKEIDHLVYQLYGLTDAEIKIVEGFDEA